MKNYFAKISPETLANFNQGVAMLIVLSLIAWAGFEIMLAISKH